MYENVCGCSCVCKCVRDHNGNTTPLPSSASSQSKHFHSNPTISCRIYLGEYLITGKTRPHPQVHTVHSNTHVSPHVLSADCCGESPQQHCQVEVWPLVVENTAK
jgi:hypothetical protein